MNEEDIINVILDRLIEQTEEKTKHVSKYWTQNNQLEILKKLSKEDYEAFIKERAVRENLISEIESLINVVHAGMFVDDLIKQLKNMIGAK